MSSNLSSDAEERKRRATNEDVREFDVLNHDFNNDDRSYEYEGEKYVNMKEPIAVLQSACGGGDDEWQRILTDMSKGINKEKNKMELHFYSDSSAWNDLSAERAVEMINHLPPSIGKLDIFGGSKYESPFMDAVIDWIEKKSTNLKSLQIDHVFVCGRNGGRDAGIELAKTLAAKNTIESLCLYSTDLIGSRNVDEWSKALKKMSSLKKLGCWGIRYFTKKVDESTFDEMNSTVQFGDGRQRIYWNDKTFPDATMTRKDVMKLKRATHATYVDIDCMVKVWWCCSLFDRCSEVFQKYKY